MSPYDWCYAHTPASDTVTAQILTVHVTRDTGESIVVSQRPRSFKDLWLCLDGNETSKSLGEEAKPFRGHLGDDHAPSLEVPSSFGGRTFPPVSPTPCVSEHSFPEKSKVSLSRSVFRPLSVGNTATCSGAPDQSTCPGQCKVLGSIIFLTRFPAVFPSCT